MTRALGSSHVEVEQGREVSSVDREIEEARAELASAEARIAFLVDSNPGIAREKYCDALRIYRELGRDERVAETLSKLGEVCGELGEASRVIEVLDEALSIFRGLQAKERVGYVLLELGGLLFGEGLFRDAEARLKEALMVLRGLGGRVVPCRGAPSNGGSLGPVGGGGCGGDRCGFLSSRGGFRGCGGAVRGEDLFPPGRRYLQEAWGGAEASGGSSEAREGL